jgi:threonine dehydrogenase-like Zn-dependent dehydrogenase
VLLEHRATGSSCAELELDPVCPLCLAGMPNLCQKAGAPVGVGGGWGEGFTAHASDLLPVPDDLTDDQAAMVEPMSVAVHSVLRRPPRDGQHLLVIGSGIIGLFTLQAARGCARGASHGSGTLPLPGRGGACLRRR